MQCLSPLRRVKIPVWVAVPKHKRKDALHKGHLAPEREALGKRGADSVSSLAQRFRGRCCVLLQLPGAITGFPPGYIPAPPLSSLFSASRDPLVDGIRER